MSIAEANRPWAEPAVAAPASEQTFRRAEYDEANSSPLVLADGQTWRLKNPKIGMKPMVREDGTIAVNVFEANSAVYSGLIQQHHFGEMTVVEWTGGIFAMARLLLLANYDLTDDRVSELLTHYPGDQESDDRFTAIRGHVTGRPVGPKA